MAVPPNCLTAILAAKFAARLQNAEDAAASLAMQAR
jgi:hypothetical protein